VSDKELKELEAIKQLLVLSLLKDDISPGVIEIASGIKAKTIRNRFPMSLIKKSK